MPPEKGSLVLAAEIIEMLNQERMPAFLTAPVIAFLDRIGGSMGVAQRTAIANRWLLESPLLRSFESNPATNAPPEPEPEKPEFVDANMSMEELMKTEDPDRNYRLVSYRDDTCAMYSFFDPMTELQRGTPRDQLQWVSEKVDGNSVCWTYRITNGDHDEAVRQILERWAEKEDEEE